LSGDPHNGVRNDTATKYLFERVSVHVLEVLEEGCGPLQGGGLVGGRRAERHQGVQLVAVRANPPPAHQRERMKCLTHPGLILSTVCKVNEAIL